VTDPTAGEGSLHHDRNKIVSNKVQLDKAYRAGLPAFIQAEQFTLKGWLPPGFEPEYNQTNPRISPNHDDNGFAYQEIQDADAEMIGSGLGADMGKKKRKKHRGARADSGVTHSLGDKVIHRALAVFYKFVTEQMYVNSIYPVGCRRC
jgi:endoribonuclease Dicer